MASYVTLMHNVLMAQGRGAELASLQDSTVQRFPLVPAWGAGAILILLDADRRAEARALFDRFHLGGFVSSLATTSGSLPPRPSAGSAVQRRRALRPHADEPHRVAALSNLHGPPCATLSCSPA